MENPPKISFPCNYPIRVIGVSSEAFRREVLDVFRKFDESVNDDKLSYRPSSGGNYESIQVQFGAESEAQLQSLFEQLKRITGIKMVL
ncbi:MAG: YbeD family protein [Pseudomonadales bacterium]